MKIAICFYGLVGGASGNDGKGFPISPKIGYDYYKKHILDKNDNVDIFIHSWSLQHQEELVDLYKPVRAKFDKQISFNPWKLIPFQIFHCKRLFPIFTLNYLKFFSTVYTLSYRAQSRWYSNKQVLNLVNKHEMKNGFKYDYIMVTRFDVAFFSNLIFKDYDPNYFYVSHRNCGPDFPSMFEWIPNKNKWDNAYADLWYFSNSDNMKKFSNLYDKMKKYSIRPPHAATQHIDNFTDNVKQLYHYGIDYYPIRFFFFGKPY